MNCQHCGEEITRGKNCPDCSRLGQAALKKNAYGAFKQTAAEVMVLTDLTPAERREMIRAAIDAGHQEYCRRANELRAAAEARKARRLAEEEAWRSGKLWRCPDCGEVASAIHPCSCMATPQVGHASAEDEKFG